MPRTDAPPNPHRSGSMILQPNDIVPLTAQEAAADIENAMLAFYGKKPRRRRTATATPTKHRNPAGRPATRCLKSPDGPPRLSNIGGERASQTSAREPDTYHEEGARRDDNGHMRTGGVTG